jgi:hypothetical protein
MENVMTRLPQFCFVLAGVTALAGMSLGIYMGIAQDHTLAPVHVHLNLLGWVSQFLFGLYYRTHENAVGRLALLQVSVSAAGYLSMMAGLAVMLLTGNEGFLPVAVAGSVLAWLGMLLFLIAVWRTGGWAHPGQISHGGGR